MRASPPSAAREPGVERPHLRARAAEHHLDRILALERRRRVRHDPHARRARARGSTRRGRPAGAAASTTRQPSPSWPQWTTGSRPAARPRAMRGARPRAASGRQRSTSPPLNHERPVVEHEGHVAPEVLGHAPGRRIAPAGREHETHAEGRAPRRSRPRAGETVFSLAAACRRCRGRGDGPGAPGSLAGPDLDALDHVAGPDPVDDVHAGDDLAEDRVAAVELRLGRGGDEELAAAGVLAGERHAHGAAP